MNEQWFSMSKKNCLINIEDISILIYFYSFKNTMYLTIIKKICKINDNK